MKLSTFRIVILMLIIIEPLVFLLLGRFHPQLQAKYWKIVLLLPTAMAGALMILFYLNRSISHTSSQFTSIFDLTDDREYLTRNVSEACITLSEHDEEDSRRWIQIQIEEFGRWGSKILDNQTIRMRPDNDSITHGDGKGGEITLVRDELERAAGIEEAPA